MPNSSTNACIAGSEAEVTDAESALGLEISTYNSLDIDGGSLTIGANGFVIDSGDGYNFVTSGTLTVNGNVTMGTSSALALQYGSTMTVTGNLTNAGDLTTGYVSNYSGPGDVLTVDGTLNNSGTLNIAYGSGGSTPGCATGVSYCVSVGVLNNTGTIIIGGATTGQASTLTLNTSGGQAGGLSTIASGSELIIGEGGVGNGSQIIDAANPSVADSGIANLSEIGGALELLNGLITTINPGGVTDGTGTLTLCAADQAPCNGAQLQLAGGSTLNVNGNLVVNAGLYMGYYSTTGDTLNVSGTLTNNDQIYVADSANTDEILTANNLYNSGTLFVGDTAGATGKVNVGFNFTNDGSAGNGQLIFQGTDSAVTVQSFTNENGGAVNFVNTGGYNGLYVEEGLTNGAGSTITLNGYNGSSSGIGPYDGSNYSPAADVLLAGTTLTNAGTINVYGYNSSTNDVEWLQVGGILNGVSGGVGVLDNSGTINIGQAATLGEWNWDQQNGELWIDASLSSYQAPITETNAGAINITGGAITFNDGGNQDSFTLTSNGTGNGTTAGVVNLNNGNIYSGYGDELLVNGATGQGLNDQVIQGTGYINIDLVNNGTINASIPGTTTNANCGLAGDPCGIYLEPTGGSSSPGVINNGLMEVTGPLSDANGTAYGSNGPYMTWSTYDYTGSSVTAPAFTNNGTVTVEDGGYLWFSSSSSGASSNAPVVSYYNNNGTITIGTASGSGGYLVLNGYNYTDPGGYATFDIGSTSGTGVIDLASSGSQIYEGGPGNLLINDTGNTIEGQGTIYVDLENNGNVTATGFLSLNPSGDTSVDGLVNYGTMTATNGGTLDFNMTSAINNTAGNPDFTGYEADFNNYDGAYVNIQAGGTLQFDNASSYSTNIDNDGTINIGTVGSATTALGGTLVLNSTGAPVGAIYTGVQGVFDFYTFDQAPGEINLYGNSMITGTTGLEEMIIDSGYNTGTSTEAYESLNDYGSSTIENLFLANNGYINAEGGTTTLIEGNSPGATAAAPGNFTSFTNSYVVNVNPQETVATTQGGSFLNLVTNTPTGEGTSYGTIADTAFFNYGTINVYAGGTLGFETSPNDTNANESIFIGNNGAINLNGNSSTQLATLQLTDNGTQTTFYLEGNGSSGGCSNYVIGSGCVAPQGVFMSNGQIIGDGKYNDQLLWNANGNTITSSNGSNLIGIDLVNDSASEVLVDSATTLDLDWTGNSTALGDINYGLMQLEGSGTLVLNFSNYAGINPGTGNLATFQDSAFANAGGFIDLYGQNATLELYNPSTNGTAYFDNVGNQSGTSDNGGNITVEAGGKILLAGGGNFDLYGAQDPNSAYGAGQGTITLEGQSDDQAYISGATCTSGVSGCTIASTTQTLTNDVNNMIQGSGIIENLILVNHGVINANAGGTLTVSSENGVLTNTGQLVATGSGNLLDITTALVNNGGYVNANGTGQITIAGDLDNNIGAEVGLVEVNSVPGLSGGNDINSTLTVTGGNVNNYGAVQISKISNFFYVCGTGGTNSVACTAAAGEGNFNNYSGATVNFSEGDTGGVATNPSTNSLLDITGALTNAGLFTMDGSGDLTEAGSVNNSGGTIDLIGDGESFTSYGSFANSGSVTLNGSATGDVLTVDGLFTNTGALSLNGVNTDVVHATDGFVNSGAGASINFGSSSSGEQMTVTGNLSNDGGLVSVQGTDSKLTVTATSGDAFTNGDSLGTNSNSTLSIQGTSAVVTLTGNLTNYGGNSVAMSGNGDTLTVTGAATNYGSLAVGTGETATAGGLFTNEDFVSGMTDLGATVTVGGTLQANGGYTETGPNSTTTISAGGVLTTGSNAYNEEGGTTTVNGSLGTTRTPTAVSVTAGNLQGIGNIFGNVTVNGGSIGGGTFDAYTVGTLTIHGSLSFGTAASFYNEQLASATSYSSITATGVISLGSNATLNLNNVGGYTQNAPIGTEYTILTGSSVTGAFENASTIDSDQLDGSTAHYELVDTGTSEVLEVLADATSPTTYYATWGAVGDSANNSGNWYSSTSTTEFACSTSSNSGPYSNCLPNNVSGTSNYDVTLDSPGNTLMIDGTTNSGTGSITINSLTLTAGTLDIASGATLNLVDQTTPITDIPAAAGLTIGGTFELNGTAADSPIGALATIEGQLTLENAQLTSISPSGGTLTVSGNGSLLEVDGGTTSATILTINGNLQIGTTTTAGNLTVGSGCCAQYGGTLNVTGDLTNYGTMNVSPASLAYASAVNVTGTLTNYGSLNIGGSAPGVVTVGTPIDTILSGSTLTLGNAGTLQLYGNAATDSALAGLSTINGSLTVENGYSGASGTVINPGGNDGTLTISGNGSGLFISGSATAATEVLVQGSVLNDTEVAIGTGCCGDLASELSITGNLNNAGSFYVGVATGVSPSTVNAGSLTNSGTLQVGTNTASTMSVSGASSNTGSVDVQNGSTLTVTTGGYAQNTSASASTTVNGAGSQLSVTGGLALSTGTLNIQDGGNVTADALSNSAAIDLGNATPSDSGSNTLALGTGASTNSGTITSSTSGNALTIKSGGSLANSGTIGATAGTLTISGPGTMSNSSSTGLEALSGGTLALGLTVNNAGGTITSSGAGSVVQLKSGADIQGGALTTTAGGSINSNGNGPLLDGSTAAGAVTITTGSTVTAATSSTLNLNGTITNNGTLQLNNAGEAQIIGAVTLNGGGTVNMAAGTVLTSSGSFTLTNVDNTIQGSGTIGLGSIALANEGTIQVTSGNSIGVSGTALNNTGNISISSGGQLAVSSGVAFSNSATVNDAGTLSMVSGVVYNQTGASAVTTVTGNMGGTGATLNINGGLLQGTGTITGAVALNGGAIAGGQFSGTQSIGTLNITGTFAIGSTTASTFDEMISGSAAADTSLVKTTGALTLGANASLSLNLLSSFSTAATGTTYEILSGSSLTGTFSNTTTIDSTPLDSGADHWELVYNDGSGTVDLEVEASSAAQEVATWTGSSADWTAATWSCSPDAAACGVPNNNATYNYSAVLNSNGQTLTVGSSDAITLSGNAAGYSGGSPAYSLVVEAGTLEIASGGSLTVDGNAILEPASTTGSADLNVGGSLTVDGNVTIAGGLSSTASLTINSGGTFTTSGGNTTIGENGYLNMTGGTFTNGGTLTVSTGTEGLLDGHGTVTGGTLTVGAGGEVDAVGGTLNLSGVTLSNLSSGGTLSGSATFYANGGLLELPGDITTNEAYIFLASPGAAIDNASGGNALAGLVENNGGELWVESGATLTDTATATFTNENSSSIYVADSGSSLTLSGGLSNDGTSYVELYDGGTLTVDGTFSNSNTSSTAVQVENGGTLTAGGLTNSGTIVTGGTGSNSINVSAGTLDNETAGAITLNETSDALSAGTLTNAGSITLNGGSESVSVGSGGTSNSGSIALSGTGGMFTSTGAFGNTGTVTLAAGNTLDANGGYTQNTSGAASTTVNGASALLAVTNGLTITTGTLMIEGGGEVTADTGSNAGSIDLNGGTFTVSGSGGFSNSNDLNIGSSIGGNAVTVTGTLTNSGTVDFQGGAGSLTAGAISNSGSIIGAIQGASVSSTNLLTNTDTGSILLGGTGDTLSAGSVMNSGSITFGGDGSALTVTGTGSFTNNSNGSLNFEDDNTSVTSSSVGGGFSNAGTLSMTGNKDVLTVAGLFSNTGTAGVGSGEALYANGGYSQTAGSTSVSGALTASGSSNNNGGAVTVANGTLTVSAGGFSNGSSAASTLTMNGTTAGTASITGGFTNGSNGTVNLSGTGDVLKTDMFSNAGTVTIGLGETLTASGATGYTQSAGTTTVAGLLGTSSVPTAVNLTGGLLQGTGTITGNVTLNGGSIAGGQFTATQSIGTLNITGAFSIGSTTASTFDEMISGSSPANTSLVGATGALTLGANASLSLNLLNSFSTAATGTTYEILSGSSLTGTFSNTTTIDDTTLDNGADHWELVYNDGSGTVDLEVEAEVTGPTDVTATWNTAAGNWNTATQWSCAPGPSTCVPNNVPGTTVYEAVLDSTAAGNVLELDDTRPLTTVNTLTMTEGTLQIDPGATLELVNQPNGITDINANSGLILEGAFVEADGTTSALANLTSVEGNLTLVGQTLTATPGGSGTLTVSGSGSQINLQDGTSFTVVGALNNSGAINLGNGAGDTGNNSLSVGSGGLTNSGSIDTGGAGNNSISVAGTGTLTNNAGTSIVLNETSDSLSAGTLTNNSGGTILLEGTSATMTSSAGLLTNNGTIGLDGDSETLTAAAGLTNTNVLSLNEAGDKMVVTGALSNSDSLDLNSPNTAATLSTVSGAFTNTSDGSLNLSGSYSDLTLNTSSGTSSNAGSIKLDGSHDVLTFNGAFTNTGSVTVGGGETLDADGGYIQNTGTAPATTVTGTLSTGSNAYTQNAGTTVVNGQLTANTFLIAAGSATVNLDATLTAGNGFINNGGSVTITDGTLSVTSGGFSNGSTMTSMFTMDSVGAGAANITGGFTNGANGTVNLGGSGDALSTDAFINNGAVTIGAGETLTASAAGGYTQAGGATTLNGSTAALGTSGTPTAVSVTGGTFQGSGSVTGNVSVSGGTIAGGTFTSGTQTPGTLTVNGAYTQTAGTFEEMIGPSSVPGADVNSALDVTGDVSLGGDLDITTLAGTTLDAGVSTFDVLNYTGTESGIWADAPSTGEFALDGDEWSIDYDDPGSVVLTYEGAATTSTPEPASLPLLVVGFFGLGLLAYRRKLASLGKEKAAAGN